MSFERPLTLSVPEAGRLYFGLSRNGSYSAARRGEIPTVQVGRLLRVPTRGLESVLNAACVNQAEKGASELGVE